MKWIAVVMAIALAGCASLDGSPPGSNRADYLSGHPGLDPSVKLAIEDGRVLIGMDWEQVRAAKGMSDDMHTLQTEDGELVQLVYRDVFSGRTSYVYLRGNRVVAVND